MNETSVAGILGGKILNEGLFEDLDHSLDRQIFKYYIKNA